MENIVLQSAIAAVPDPGRATSPVRRVYGRLGRLIGRKAVPALLRIPTLILATHALGVTAFGVLMLASSFTALVGGIAEFPCWQAVLRYGAEALQAGDEPRLLRLLRATALVEAAGGVVAVSSAGLLGALFGARLGWSPPAIAFAIPFAFTTLASIRSVPAAFLQLRDRYDLLALHSLLQPGTRLVGATAAWATGAGLPGFLAAWLVAALVEFAGLWLLAGWVAHHQFGFRRLLGSPRGVFTENDRLLPFMLGANADVTFGDLADRLIPVVVGWYAGPAMTGLLRIAQRATAILSQPAAMLGRTAYAEFAVLAAARNRTSLRAALRHCTGVALAASLPVLLLVALLRHDIVHLLGGRDFAGAAGPMVLLVGAQAILLVAPPVTAALVALGRPGRSLLANTFARLLMLPLLPWAIGRFGLPGVGLQAIAVAVATDLGLLAMLRSTLSE